MEARVQARSGNGQTSLGLVTPKAVKRTAVTRAVPTAGPAVKTSKAVKVQVEFKIEAPEAESVAVAGDFNQWNPKGTPMVREGKLWKASLSLARGRYEYRFVVDGRWISDPGATESAPNGYGENNSVFSI